MSRIFIQVSANIEKFINVPRIFDKILTKTFDEREKNVCQLIRDHARDFYAITFICNFSVRRRPGFNGALARK